MLASQGKVLSPGNEGSLAVIVYVYIHPECCFNCVHMPISMLPALLYGCNSMHMPNARVSVCTVRQPAC